MYFIFLNIVTSGTVFYKSFHDLITKAYEMSKLNYIKIRDVSSKAITFSSARDIGSFFA